MLTCKQITELVTAYAEGQLRFMDRLRFQMHIGMCKNCRAYVRQLQATAKAMGKLPEPEIPPDLKDELLRRFDGWKAQR
jgi:anti-sigma factor ChrR (cupin superfamily)